MVLTGIGRRTGKPHKVKLWFFSDDSHFYLMTYARRHGRGTDWYRNLRKQRSAQIEVGQRRYAGHLVAVEDPEPFLQQITEMFAAKYGWQLVRSYYTETKRIPIKLRFERAPDS
jgi:deazaflavin-dependent oxidoreductase (nitroreductase family)